MKYRRNPLNFCKTITWTFMSFAVASAMSQENLPQASGDWPEWRGPKQDGKAWASGLLDHNEPASLKIVWQKRLGSGYSSISIAQSRAVTMFSDGSSDQVVALDSESGTELWRFAIASTYKAHDGTYEGPISTPLIEDGRVFALGPKGQFVALDLETGQELWSTDLRKEHSAKTPYFGYSTSPLVYKNIVILQTGGQNGNAITGFDKRTGAVSWVAGSDDINHQIPILAEIAGRHQLVSPGFRRVYGLDPKTGEVLWEYFHDKRIWTLNPVVVGANELFLSYNRPQSRLIRVKHHDGKYLVNEVWESTGIRETYNVSIHHEGYLYGYHDTFLTCIDAGTGRKAWRSRAPGDGFTMFVDGHLLVMTQKGSLHLIKASPDGYRELASLKVFEGLTWTPASLAYERIYVRNLFEIACVQLISENL